ncbi:MAG: hypothetical protein P8Z35_00545 [Ignavibacteriaceae bacterium]|jgi:hypothetical protein
MKAKLFSTSALFFTAGIISFFRSTVLELVISISFSLVFLGLNLWLSSEKNRKLF